MSNLRPDEVEIEQRLLRRPDIRVEIKLLCTRLEEARRDLETSRKNFKTVVDCYDSQTGRMKSLERDLAQARQRNEASESQAIADTVSDLLWGGESAWIGRGKETQAALRKAWKARRAGGHAPSNDELLSDFIRICCKAEPDWFNRNWLPGKGRKVMSDVLPDLFDAIRARCAPATAGEPDEDADEAYIRQLKWSPEATEDEKALVAGNIRNFWKVCLAMSEEYRRRQQAEPDEKVKAAHEACPCRRMSGIPLNPPRDWPWCGLSCKCAGYDLPCSWDGHAAIDAIVVAKSPAPGEVEEARRRLNDWCPNHCSEQSAGARMYQPNPDPESVAECHHGCHTDIDRLALLARRVPLSIKPIEVEEAILAAIREEVARCTQPGIPAWSVGPQCFQEMCIGTIKDRLAALARGAAGEMPGEEELARMIHEAAIATEPLIFWPAVARWVIAHFRDYRAEGWTQ